MIQADIEALYDQFVKQESDVAYLGIRRVVDDDKSFSADSIDELIERLATFVGARIMHHWDKTGAPPKVASVKIRVDVD